MEAPLWTVCSSLPLQVNLSTPWYTNRKDWREQAQKFGKKSKIRTKQLSNTIWENLDCTGVVFAFIILFNLSRPQTKRKHIIADLISQARGTIFICFLNFFLWLFAYLTYMRNAESDMPNLYWQVKQIIQNFTTRWQLP